MRAICWITACIVFSLAIRCPAGRVAEDPTFTPITGELVYLDPANGHGKSLLRVRDDSLGKPVVIDKTLYVASGHALFALDAKTGEIKWQVASAGSIFGVTATSQVVFYGAAGTLVAVEPTGGRELWKYEGDLAIVNPTLIDSMIVFNTVDGPVALDQQTGKFRWRLGMQWGYFVFSSMSDHRLCVWKPDEIFVVDAESGKTLWQSAADQSVSAPGALPTPAMAAGDLICQLRGAPKDANDWSIFGREGGSGRSLWKTPLGQHEAAGAKTTLADKAGYCILEDQLSAVDLIDGKLKWQTAVKPMEAGGAGLLAAHGLVYLPQLGGEVTALDEKTGRAKWIAGAPTPSPHGQIRVGGICVSDSAVYVTRNDQTRQ